MLLHPIQRRYLAEELTRLRRPDEHARVAASQRQGRIDPNPHQIDAVIFALRRLPEGGCILADEVGLGKTIEAGLVVAQLRAEGANRVLIIVPKSLLGQWQEELRSLFGMEAREVTDAASLAGTGIFIIGREAAGSARGSAALGAAERFDLCVIDEAHEIFAGIHKRYDAAGALKEDSTDALMAHRVRGFLGTTPVLLLTATPIQNSLTELWGLAQYIEPTGTLLGDLRTFRDLFCDGDDRRLVAGQEDELRRRLARICQRTLRRQAQDFLEHPFVDRHCLLLEYAMSPAEKALYDDVTEYLLEPSLCAFAGKHRQLLLIAFHRLMGSSVRALAKGLENVAARLTAALAGENDDGSDDAMASDLEDDELAPGASEAQIYSPEEIQAELDRVQAFIQRARALPGDGKAALLKQALKMARERHSTGKGSGKAVIFTESLSTQEYIRDFLIAGGIPDGQITLFRGQNQSPRAEEAVSRWWQEIGDALPSYKRPSREVAVRTALVHEFRTRSTVFISTEAGAKGLNLQFCDMVINYDLPWNPQRIEQRIGRCHRYGQEREVTVVNFIAKDNEAHRLLHEILSQKLDLFGRVLDASDQVLHEAPSTAGSSIGSALSVELEGTLRKIYERSRSRDEIVAELRRLREEVGRLQEDHADRLRATSGLIESRFDTDVRQAFRRLQEEVPLALARWDRALDRLLTSYLSLIGAPFQRQESKLDISYQLAAFDGLPTEVAKGGRFVLGSGKRVEGADPLHLTHPLVRAALDEARSASGGSTVRFTVPGSAAGALQARRGRRGRLTVTKIRYLGLEPTERLITVALVEGDANALPVDQAAALLTFPAADIASLAPPRSISIEQVQDAIDEALFMDQTEIEQGEQAHFERALDQIEHHADDRTRLLKRKSAEVERALTAAQTRRDAALSFEVRKSATDEVSRLEASVEVVGKDIERLESRADDRYLQLRDDLQRRRYVAPRSETFIDVEFVLS